MEKLLLIQKLETLVKYYSQALLDICEFQTFARIPTKIELETIPQPQVQQNPPQTQQISQPITQQITHSMAKKLPQEIPSTVPTKPKGNF